MKKNTITHNTSVDALIAVTKRLMRYEDRYNMASEEFYNQFCKGQAEDSEDFIEWANTYQHFIALRRDLESNVLINFSACYHAVTLNTFAKFLVRNR